MAIEGSYVTVTAEEMEKLQRRIRELEREVEEMEKLEMRIRELEREVEEMKTEMVKLWRRTVVAEEAEERLCSQLAEQEVDSLDEARDYHDRMLFLTDHISRLSSSSVVSSS